MVCLTPEECAKAVLMAGGLVNVDKCRELMADDASSGDAGMP